MEMASPPPGSSAASNSCPDAQQMQWKVQTYMDMFQDEKQNLQTYVVFFATAHSGHSLVGSLLDAHPMMLLANEDDIFSRYLNHPRAEYSHFKTPLENKDEIFDSILHNSLKCALYSRYQHAYNYTVPHGWGGHWIPGKLRVIGDKKGGKTITRLKELMEKSNGEMVRVFKEFQKVIGLPIHIIHVFWDKDSKDYRNIEKILGILQNEISSDVLSASEWDNKVYTCGDVKSQQALFLETCNALNVPCDSTVMDMWMSMASCKISKKHIERE